ncbi:type I toxin-antitoxin system toxin HokA [Escherichia coli]|nr:type I toxin-antitoxin system toxin HokA [Escherichia coli]EFC2869715.1 type I toxin-antitoxin system toxin HokA [Escherichia coli]EGG2482100.1 type I toxin-antitoxin system toxin HokA [Escherichia coli]EJY2082784.1 type I toxin-antitoxin system toxin HokA [Escherichia coli]
MPQKYRLLSLIVICFTLLFFTWMIRDSLCELHIKQGSYSRLSYGVAHSHCTQIYFSQK